MIENGIREDLQTLDGSNWLNDMVINQYLNLIQERNDTSTCQPRMLAMNTYVYDVLNKDGLEEREKRLEGWFKVDLRTKDLPPMNTNYHLTMVIINTNIKIINYLIP